jgi:hypothetical protein
VVVEELLQLLVGEVDTQLTKGQCVIQKKGNKGKYLFKAICLEDFKTGDIQYTYKRNTFLLG